MSETPSSVVASASAPVTKPYPAWTDILRQVGRSRSDPSHAVVQPQDWHTLVADMIIGQRR